MPHQKSTPKCIIVSRKNLLEILALVDTKIYTKIIKLSPEINPVDKINGIKLRENLRKGIAYGINNEREKSSK